MLLLVFLFQTNRLPVPSDIDSASVSSRAKYKGEEQITLSAHGIGPVGEKQINRLIFCHVNMVRYFFENASLALFFLLQVTRSVKSLC